MPRQESRAGKGVDKWLLGSWADCVRCVLSVEREKERERQTGGCGPSVDRQGGDELIGVPQQDTQPSLLMDRVEEEEERLSFFLPQLLLGDQKPACDANTKHTHTTNTTHTHTA